MVSKLSDYDPGCSSRIRILIFYPSRIQESKRHRIPDPQHWFQIYAYTGMSTVVVLLKGLGEERLPEWEVGDPALHQAGAADPELIMILIRN